MSSACGPCRPLRGASGSRRPACSRLRACPGCAGAGGGPVLGNLTAGVQAPCLSSLPGTGPALSWAELVLQCCELQVSLSGRWCWARVCWCISGTLSTWAAVTPQDPSSTAFLTVRRFSMFVFVFTVKSPC